MRLLLRFSEQTDVNIDINTDWPAKTLPPRGAGWEPGRLAFQS